MEKFFMVAILHVAMTAIVSSWRCLHPLPAENVGLRFFELMCSLHPLKYIVWEGVWRRLVMVRTSRVYPVHRVLRVKPSFGVETVDFPDCQDSVLRFVEIPQSSVFPRSRERARQVDLARSSSVAAVNPSEPAESEHFHNESRDSR